MQTGKGLTVRTKNHHRKKAIRFKETKRRIYYLTLSGQVISYSKKSNTYLQLKTYDRGTPEVKIGGQFLAISYIMLMALYSNLVAVYGLPKTYFVNGNNKDVRIRNVVFRFSMD